MASDPRLEHNVPVALRSERREQGLDHVDGAEEVRGELF